MALHIRAEEADRLVREFARRCGVGLTEAVKLAIREASRNDKDSFETFMESIRPVLERARAARKQAGLPADLQVDDKQFMDEMWGEPDCCSSTVLRSYPSLPTNRTVPLSRR